MSSGGKVLDTSACRSVLRGILRLGLPSLPWGSCPLTFRRKPSQSRIFQTGRWASSVLNHILSKFLEEPVNKKEKETQCLSTGEMAPIVWLSYKGYKRQRAFYELSCLTILTLNCYFISPSEVVSALTFLYLWWYYPPHRQPFTTPMFCRKVMKYNHSFSLWWMYCIILMFCV